MSTTLPAAAARAAAVSTVFAVASPGGSSTRPEPRKHVECGGHVLHQRGAAVDDELCRGGRHGERPAPPVPQGAPQHDVDCIVGGALGAGVNAGAIKVSPAAATASPYFRSLL